MNRLSFENVDVVNTPLSSLRSCSEYQTRQERKIAAKKVPTSSYWSSLLSWSLFTRRRRKHRVRFADSDEVEQEFMVDRFRFNSSNLMEGEDYDYSTERRFSSTSSRLTSGDKFARKRLFSDSESSRRRSRSSFIQEASWLVDYMFGYNTNGASSHTAYTMEIELQTLRPPQILTVYDALHSPSENDSADVEGRESGVGFRRVTSLRSLERILPPEDSVRQSFSFTRTYSGSSSSNTASPAAVSNDQAFPEPYWTRLLAMLRDWYQPDEVFYESIRIQPFSSGAYLRGMLLAGISSLFFQIFNLVVHWPIFEAVMQLSLTNRIVCRLLMINLCIQILVNAVSLPNRIQIHFQCWESSRAVEVDAAIRLIRTMLRSDSWLVNKALGHMLDLLTLFNIVVTELYLWVAPHDDPLRSFIVSLCATNLLTFVCRIVVATMYSLSMHDPQVLSEARRRGLSKWDLEVLPTFVFSRREEVNNPDCSICLAAFDIGEMLISLPCDRKHSFHASCIRQWLQRQNSCPLCQKLV